MGDSNEHTSGRRLNGENLLGDSYNYDDYFKVRMSGVDNLNNNYKTHTNGSKVGSNPEIPPASELSDEMLVTFVELLENKIVNINQQIGDSPAQTQPAWSWSNRCSVPS